MFGFVRSETLQGFSVLGHHALTILGFPPYIVPMSSTRAGGGHIWLYCRSGVLV